VPFGFREQNPWLNPLGGTLTRHAQHRSYGRRNEGAARPSDYPRHLRSIVHERLLAEVIIRPYSNKPPRLAVLGDEQFDCSKAVFMQEPRTAVASAAGDCQRGSAMPDSGVVLEAPHLERLATLRESPLATRELSSSRLIFALPLNCCAPLARFSGRRQLGVSEHRRSWFTAGRLLPNGLLKFSPAARL
jgi:hypothetical protein